MPIIGVKRDKLFEALGQTYSASLLGLDIARTTFRVACRHRWVTHNVFHFV